MKACTKCGLKLPLDRYGSDKSKSDGLYPSCRDCASISKLVYYYKNRSVLSEKYRQRYATDTSFRDHVNDNAKVYYKNNSEKVKSRIRLWAEANHEKVRKNKASVESRRRARVRGLEVVKYDRDYIFERDNGICGICSKRVDKSLRWPNSMSFSINHIVPISKGGADTPDNVETSHLVCNMRVGNRCTT